jgi:hypothetical protein
MQSVNKYNRKNRIGLGWITSGAVLTILAVAIGLMLSKHQPAAVIPAVPASNTRPAPIAHERTLADVISSGQYPFGASGFDSLLPSQPVRTRDRTLVEIMGSGQYPFGASGFDSLLSSQPARTRDRTLADVISSGQYPFGATGFDSLLPSQRSAHTTSCSDQRTVPLRRDRLR